MGAPHSGIVVERGADLLGRRPVGGALQAAIAGSELVGLPLGLVVQILQALLQAGPVPREPTGVGPRLVDGVAVAPAVHGSIVGSESRLGSGQLLIDPGQAVLGLASLKGDVAQAAAVGAGVEGPSGLLVFEGHRSGDERTQLLLG